MNHPLRTFLAVAGLLGGAAGACAQSLSLPLEIRQSAIPYNFQAQRGVPISTTVNTNTGSDGRMSTTNESFTAGGSIRSTEQPTTNQFQGYLSFGGVPGLTQAAWLSASNSPLLNGSNTFSGAVAVAMGLPLGTADNVPGSAVVIILRRGQIGSPYLSRQVSFPFGSIVAAPATDENGILLTNTTSTAYWLPQPYSTNNHADSGYYWSPNAGSVYAIQSGPLQVTWIKAAYSNSVPFDYASNSNSYWNNGGNYFRLHTASYVVSGSPAKPPRKMYWTENSFYDLGKPVAVPPARVGAVLVAYNNNFPLAVNEADRYVAPGETPPGGTTNQVLNELRTLWYDSQQGTIRAYNREGRVFLEILGDPRPDGQTREQLGIEIVDVVKSPSPLDVAGELGERLVEPEPGLVPEPILQVGGQPFAYSQNVGGSGLINLYATRATVNLNDYLVHWLEVSQQGLKWPRVLGRYHLDWPREVERYSHYVRPVVATDEQARATAVPLPTEIAPTLEFQDVDSAGLERGRLTEAFRYYSFLDAGFPAHRALLRFTSGEDVAFERVFSWLDVNLKATNLANTVAGDLTSVANYLTDSLTYPAALSNYNAAVASYTANLAAYLNYTNYTNYLATRSRGVNGEWTCFGGYLETTGPAGSIGSWSLVVETQAEGGGARFTNEFAGAGFSFSTNDYSYTSVSVAGITNAVTALRLKVNGVSNANPAQMFVFLAGPQNAIFTMNRPGASNAAVNVNLVFDDLAAQPVTTNLVSGTYRLQSGTLDSLLLPVVPEVTRPAEPFVTNPPAILPLPVPVPTLWPNEFTAPRVVRETVTVGQRISAPAGELGGAANYLAGYIHQPAGTLFNPGAYVDPFVVGFDAARQRAIIPVNAIPGTNSLEVWWFRTNTATAGANAANTARGFLPIYWPSVIGRYTLEFPSDPADEIVLASNDGSGPLPSYQATGSIYYQNDRTAPGFNPNEEHALMQGGQAWALRDDLNIVTNGPGHTSEPFVLLDYTETDGRPAMRAFKVRRESDTEKFNYLVEAGAVLQPPMPLPLMEKPLGPKVTGSEPRSLNQETYFRTIAQSTTNGELTTVEAHHFRPWFRELALQSPDLVTTKWLFATNAHYGSNSLAGVVSDTRAFRLANGTPQPSITTLTLLSTLIVTNYNPGSTNTNRIYQVVATGVYRYDNPDAAPVTTGKTVYVMAPEISASWAMDVHATNAGPAFDVALSFTNSMVESQDEILTLASAQVTGAATALLEQFPDEAQLAQATLLFLPSGAVAPNQFANWQLRTEPIPASGIEAQGSFTLQDRKGNLWVYRGPHRAGDPSWMAMQFYYRTLPGFFFPTLSLAQQPPPGTITPYLRDTNSDGSFAGDAIYGNAVDALSGDNNAMAVHYRPVWPAFAPVLQMAETLTVPKRGLPAMRGQSSLEVVYQQSTVTNPADVSVRLHDPTVQKVFPLGPVDGTAKLGKIPDSVLSEASRGKTYFPLLPPHLSQRFFLDPSVGPNGSLLFQGEFVDDLVGDKYLNLNLLSAKDLTTLKNLCLITDPARSRWNNAIDGLTNAMTKYIESPQQPGTYVPAEGATVIGPGGLSEVSNDDVAVDSYALTAVGPGSGYVSLIAGNGLAFTPRADPVSVLVLRVSDVLYPGQVKVIASPNPLAETLTMQQVVDLAGQTSDFGFQWKIAAPVDGFPPKVYDNTRRLFFDENDGIPWNHVPFPLASDSIAAIATTPAGRLTFAVSPTVIAVGSAGFSLATVSTNDGKLIFPMGAGNPLVSGNQVTVLGQVSSNNTLVTGNFPGTVAPGSTATHLIVDFGRTDFQPLEAALHEAVQASLPQSIVFREFAVPAGSYSQLWLSLDLDTFLAANVYLNGERVVVANQGAGSTETSSPPAGFNALPSAYLLDPAILARSGSGATNRVVVELFSQAVPGTAQRFNVRLEAYEAVDKTEDGWLPLDVARFPDGIRAVIGEAADVQALTDNYLIMRYRATNVARYSSGSTNWSRWTTPQLAEGWIKRVLAGINPFNQRTQDLFNNSINTDASLLISAGRRFEGSVALNLDSINDYGLIEIYETVLQRGRLLSVDGGINYGPANDALLLAAGYLNDLYMIVGNEASADAANPTIGIGTADQTYGDIATALFSFKGQMASVLEEELALLRGRDDFFQPGVGLAPVYNRLVWNYTRGIDSGEVIYAINYNIQENPNASPDGVINAADAARMFPQGHGDAYGHYLTALKGYYSLLLNQNFDWVPRIEAVTVLGVPVSVDYQDERKFAATAAAVGRAGRQVFDLTWRKDYTSGHDFGWSTFSSTRVNTQRTVPTTRYWGLDHWASRTGQGNFINWVVGNAILPAVDPDPTHEGIQKIDRTTVPELSEIATMAADLQTALDNAEAGFTPVGLPQGSLALDINPNVVVGPDNGTHFEQIYGRAKITLQNAVAAFDDAKDVTRLMRSEQDSLADLQAAVRSQELAYSNALIDLYGTPYPDDIGPGKTYKQGYAGPDLLHFAYTEMPQLTYPGLLTNTVSREFRIDIQDYTSDYENSDKSRFDFVKLALNNNPDYLANTNYISFTLAPSGSFEKPSNWTGRRASPGRLQEAIGRIHLARKAALGTLSEHEKIKRNLDRSIEYFQAVLDADETLRGDDVRKAENFAAVQGALFAAKIGEMVFKNYSTTLDKVATASENAIPKSTVVGLANGGDLFAPARAALLTAAIATQSANSTLNIVKQLVVGGFELGNKINERFKDVNEIQPLIRSVEHKGAVLALDATLSDLHETLFTINQRLQELDDAVRNYQALVAQGDRLQGEREVYRQRSSAIVQGFRTRDAAFRIFRNEKLERYKTLFDLAARYSFLAANAYDYETGLLNTDSGRGFVNRIISARALGVVREGEPQFAGSNTGDPGLSSALAEMKADWDTVKTRLGFNNPDAYGTTLSLRTEKFRIPPTTNSVIDWQDLLQANRKTDLLADEDVRRHCLQISRGPGLPVPGIIIEFSTTIENGYNFFGRELAAGDHSFSPSSFATKIFGVGAALEGYRGMDQPAANGDLGGITPPDPNLWYLDPLALAATPYVYLIPVGVDSMRSPPLGDTGEIRSWTVDDVAIPLPFNIGASTLSSGGYYQSADSLSEPLFTVRKHQAFRPVPSASYFSTSLYGDEGTLRRSQYTNNRLIGRSAWNSRWKLVIPGHTLLNNPDEGLERLINTVHDIKLHFVTYSYSGN